MISIVINCDTRPGSDADCDQIREQAASPGVCGVHSLDFLTDGVVAKNRFLRTPGHELETIVYVDVHEPIPHEVRVRIQNLIAAGEITKFVETPHSKHRHRWNDRLYLDALSHVSPHADYVAHFDGDCVGFRRAGYDHAARCIELIEDAEFRFVCQQSPLTPHEHGMRHASTRFLFTRRAELDIPELERLTDDAYRAATFPGQHLPCLEHILGARAGAFGVCYPMAAYADCVVFSWVRYHRGTLAKLNAMPYADVRRYVFDQCGGPLGAADLVGKEIE